MNNKRENTANRRNFLKASIAGGASIALAGAAVNAAFPRLIPEKMLFETNCSHWAKALPSANPPLQEDIEADVAVIGGGFTGSLRSPLRQGRLG